MTTFNYTRDIPDGPNDPSVDQPDMKINTNSIDDLIAVDHRSFGVTDGGYHRVIHQTLQVSDPAAIPSRNQVYSKNYTPNFTGSSADTQLFTLTGAGVLSQLTGYSAASEGWQWIGGILLQWGTVSMPPGSGHLSQTVTFKDRLGSQGIPFPNNCFSLTATLIPVNQAETNDSSIITIVSVTNLNFRWLFNSSSGTGTTRYPQFYWIAIGN